MSLSTCYLKYGSHLTPLHRRCRRRRRRGAYAPTSNTASHDNHEKINSWISFCFPYMGCLWGSASSSRRSSAIKHMPRVLGPTHAMLTCIYIFYRIGDQQAFVMVRNVDCERPLFSSKLCGRRQNK